VLGDGEFFLQRLDASLAGAGPHYELRRTYRSGLENDSPFGPGWDHNYDQRILGSVIYYNSPGLDSLYFDDPPGVTQSVAMTPDGVAVEVHKSKADNTLSYHVGRVSGDTINWGPSHPYDNGVTPSVAITPDEGDRRGRKRKLWYHVGRVSGDTINWGPSYNYDHGVTPSVAITPDGVAVEVHKSQSDDTLWFHRGKVSGDTINWGPSRKYDDGITPAVAVNFAGLAVEVHTEHIWPDSDYLLYHLAFDQPFDPTTIGDLIQANCDGTVQFQDGEGSFQLFTKIGWHFFPGTYLPVEIFVPESGDLRLEHLMSGGSPKPMEPFQSSTAPDFYRL
jgi:Domain of unknown function (DUF6531)